MEDYSVQIDCVYTEKLPRIMTGKWQFDRPCSNDFSTTWIQLRPLQPNRFRNGTIRTDLD